jgi:hypothetical protein
MTNGIPLLGCHGLFVVCDNAEGVCCAVSVPDALAPEQGRCKLNPDSLLMGHGPPKLLRIKATFV